MFSICNWHSLSWNSQFREWVCTFLSISEMTRSTLSYCLSISDGGSCTGTCSWSLWTRAVAGTLSWLRRVNLNLLTTKYTGAYLSFFLYKFLRRLPVLYILTRYRRSEIMNELENEKQNWRLNSCLGLPEKTWAWRFTKYSHKFERWKSVIKGNNRTLLCGLIALPGDFPPKVYWIFRYCLFDIEK